MSWGRSPGWPTSQPPLLACLPQSPPPPPLLLLLPRPWWVVAALLPLLLLLLLLYPCWSPLRRVPTRAILRDLQNAAVTGDVAALTALTGLTHL